MTPELRIDAVSSDKPIESKDFLGWLGFGATESIGTSRSVSPSAGVDESRAPRPRPSPRLFMAQHLARQVEVGERPARPDIVEDDRLAVARRLGQADTPGNDR